MSELEIRSSAGEIRAVSDKDHTFELRIVKYGVVDSYGSVWSKGVFTRSLEQKLPPATWGHNWERIIGSVVEHDERDDGHYGLVKMADFGSVPDARMAFSLIKDGHIKDTSFGFKRSAWSDTRNDEAYKPSLEGEKELIRQARLDEVSPVLVGAVPSAQILSVRSDNRISVRSAGDILTAVAVGQMTLREALNILEDERADPDESKETPAQKAIEAHMAKTPHTFVASPEDPNICEICDRAKSNPVHTSRSEEPEPIDPVDLEIALDLMQRDGIISPEFRFVKSADGAKGEAKLKEYWAHGEGAAKIVWGTDGDFDRCVVQLSKYVGPGIVKGLCSNLHVLATGARPGHAPGEKK